MVRRIGFLILAIAETLGFVVVAGAILFGAAGTIHVPSFWLYLGVSTVLYLLALGLIYLRSPDLIQERLHPGAGEKDKVSIAAMVALLALDFGIAGLDLGRFHWTHALPLGAQVAGLVAVVCGFAIILWAMLVNQYFSSAVRLQEDRGQTVITSGPYRFVRHPGYTGGILFMVANGIALGSWLSVLPMLLVIPILIRRTLIEETMLQDGLPGYAEYMKRVRYRIIPGVW
jgi:protein-S-isoprenylcysteine O-methyltransferase Ste14